MDLQKFLYYPDQNLALIFVQSVELTNEALDFLKSIFDAFDGDGVCHLHI